MRFRRRPQAPRFWPQRRRRGIFRGARPILLAAILAILWAGFDPLLVEPPAFLAGEPKRISTSFSRRAGLRTTGPLRPRPARNQAHAR
jgi:hypothetical protein